MTYKKKLIEVALPLEAINREAAREKSIRHGYLANLPSVNPEDRARGIGARSKGAAGLAGRPVYVRRPFQREPDFGVTSVTYRLDELLARGGAPT